MASGTIDAGLLLKNMPSGGGTIVSVPSGADTLTQEFTLSAGDHVILISAMFRATNGTGSRKVMCSFENEDKKNLIEIAPNPNGYTTVGCFTTYKLTTGGTLKVWINQTSGSAMNCLTWVNDIQFG